MKKYVSSEFIATKYGIYKAAQDILTSYPSTIIANSGNVAPWVIYGNESSGDYVGEKTTNLCSPIPYKRNYSVNSEGVEIPTDGFNIFSVECTENTTYTLSLTQSLIGTTVRIHTYNNGVWIEQTASASIQNVPTTFTTPADADEIRISITNVATGKIMLNTGNTALPYEPYGYKIPFSCGENNYTIYMTDVLRKSSGLDPVYDVMSSSGTITRNVDTDGTPLVIPTTEIFTPPTIATAAGNNIINFGTTVKPSKMELTYTGWHMYDDKKRTGGEWG